MRSAILLCSLLSIALSSCTTPGTGELADIIYTNGKIYTVNEKQPWADAVAIKDGKFIAVGDVGDIEGLKGEATQSVDLGGKFVMPGFIDSHMHLPIAYIQEEAGRLLYSPAAQSPEEVKQGLLAYAKDNPGAGWIRGSAFDMLAFSKDPEKFPDAKPTREFLDAIIPDRPVLLYDITQHDAVANSKALELAGVTKDTPDPPAGAIDRDPKTGEPTGYLGERGISLVGSKIEPRIDVPATVRALEKGLAEIRALGITSIIDMMAFERSLKGYRQLQEEGKLTCRVSAAIAMNDYTEEYSTIEESNALVERMQEYATDLITVDSFKFWFDGTPYTYTSKLIEPYSDRDTLGEVTMTPDNLAKAQELIGKGLIGRFHSIGDGSTRETLDLIAEVRKSHPDVDRFVHIAHNMMVSDRDIPRYNELNVIVDFSPALWFPQAMTDSFIPLIGEQRNNEIYPVKKFYDAGVRISIGTDWPAATPTADPLRGLEGLVTRKNPYGEHAGQLGEPVSVEVALRLMTQGGAMAMNREQELGSIEVGKYADMIVVDRNFLEIEPENISEATVLQTIFGGKVIYDSATGQPPTTKNARHLQPLAPEVLAMLGGCGRCAREWRRAEAGALRASASNG